MSARYAFILSEEGNYAITLMCRCLEVSKSGYMDWKIRPVSEAEVRRSDLTHRIRASFEASDATYGYRRIHAELERMGVVVCQDTVRTIMREEGLVAVQPRLRVRTTIPAGDIDEREDLVGRDFHADAPGLKWVGDITYIPTWVGFCYLATVLDCCTKKVVGYAIADHMRTALIQDALTMAVKNCPHTRGVTIFHSDRGSQYTSEAFAHTLSDYGIRASCGKTGVCWDNAWAESFNATLKNERVHRMVYPTREKAIRDIVWWIELRYNQKRLHSSLGYRTPNEVEAEYMNRSQAA